jgi:hypothetical protein
VREIVDKGSEANPMKGPALPTVLLFAVAIAPAQDISGEWHGSVDVTNDAPLRLALHIANSNTASVDSADEGVSALPVDSVERNGATLKFEIKNIAGVYEGKVAPDGSRITGTWSQDGGVWPLIWERGEDPANIAQPIRDTEAKHKGQACAQWFYEGTLAELWHALSPVMQQALGSEGQLAEFREQTIRQLGSETQIVAESVKPAGVLQVYQRIAKFQRAEGNIEVKFAFDPRGLVAVFSISANR